MHTFYMSAVFSTCCFLHSQNDVGGGQTGVTVRAITKLKELRLSELNDSQVLTAGPWGPVAWTQDSALHVHFLPALPFLDPSSSLRSVYSDRRWMPQLLEYSISLALTSLSPT